AQTPSFHFVGMAPGGTSSFVYGLSADGRVATGFTSSGLDVNPGFTWTAAGGRNDFRLEPGLAPTTTGIGISGDGTAGVGESSSCTTSPRAYRWHGTGTYQTLGLLSGYMRMYGQGVNGDGSVVVGRAEAGSPGTQAQAFRWTSAGGLQGLGFTRPNSG